MTKESQRIAMAEFCGWVRSSRGEGSFTDPEAMIQRSGWRNPRGVFDTQKSYWPPDYTEDLNAVHEAEEMLLGEVGWVHYSQVLLKGNIHATAAQRCEAILRTIGKWVEDAPNTPTPGTALGGYHRDND